MSKYHFAWIEKWDGLNFYKVCENFRERKSWQNFYDAGIINKNELLKC